MDTSFNDFIKDSNMKVEKLTGKRFGEVYNEKDDEYTCHNKKILRPIGTITWKSKSGYISFRNSYKVMPIDVK